MSIFLNLFKLRMAGKPANEAKKDSLEPVVPNHQEDASQGGEFVDDVIWEEDQSQNAESQQAF
ncbi:hypothetical protein [Spirosoma jeollabukense]